MKTSLKHALLSFFCVVVASLLIVSNLQFHVYDFSAYETGASEKQLGQGRQVKEQPSLPDEEQIDEAEDSLQKRDETAKDSPVDDAKEGEGQSDRRTDKPGAIVNNTPNVRVPSKVPSTTPSNKIEVVPVADAQHSYFTTNITNNEVVTEPIYYVTITHLQATLREQALRVELNGKELKDYKGELTLQEGKNSVRFTVVYEDTGKKEISVTQDYAIYLNTKEPVIFTNLTQGKVSQPNLSFTAQAKKKNEHIPLKVSMNGDIISALGGTVYKVTLKQGKNHINLQADGVQQQYIIYYEEPTTVIELQTDLKDQRFTEEQFSFYVQATAKDMLLPVTVKVNGQISSSSNARDYYTTLQQGTNIITITAQYEQEQLVKQYTILYKNPNLAEEEKIDPKAPIITTNLKDNLQVTGSLKNFNVWAKSASGERIAGRDVLVKLNGVNVPFIWDDSAKTSYRLQLRSGANEVVIKAWDTDGRVVTRKLTIYSKDVQQGEPIGKIQISVEASTIGIPYLISPTEVTIHQGERGSYVVDQLLRDNGFTYRKTGSLDSSFYLATIQQPNLLKDMAIPSDLWALIEQNATQYNKENYHPDALGEFTFTNGSGWMYSINGDYPNYSFSDAYFNDGDIVRIRYTLYYGADINGMEGMGDGKGNWHKEW